MSIIRFQPHMARGKYDGCVLCLNWLRRMTNSFSVSYGIYQSHTAKSYIPSNLSICHYEKNERKGFGYVV